MGQYLTLEYKKKWLNKNQLAGEYDQESKEFMSLCKNLNTYDGVCTVNFFDGRSEVGCPTISIMPGQGFLWLWLDKEMFDFFPSECF